MPRQRMTKITQNYWNKGVFTFWKRITKGKLAGRFKARGYVAKARTGIDKPITLSFIGTDYDDTWQEIKIKRK